MAKLPKKIVGRKLLVLPDKVTEKTHGGIIIPVTANQLNETGIVAMVSEHILHIAPGDHVVYPKNAGIPEEYDGKLYKFLNGPTNGDPGDVIAII